MNSKHLTKPFEAGIPERRLYLLFTRSLCSKTPLLVLEEAIEGGVDLVQLREKPLTRKEIPWIKEVAALCNAMAVPLVLNDRIDLAKELGACCVHLGQEDLGELQKTQGLKEITGLPFGLSTHSPEELRASLALSPAYVGIGPCFATATKGYQQGLPPRRLAAMLEIARERQLPAFAIGGIDAKRLPGLMDLGVRRIAVSSCILGAPAPREAARTLRELLLGGPEPGHPIP
ncbi:MAG TPA: thiamine phosphate synthase [Planctomycetes bacterium]|nr:thiamine phosphate synthase [Planctomycetota bacterium]